MDLPEIFLVANEIMICFAGTKDIIFSARMFLSLVESERMSITLNIKQRSVVGSPGEIFLKSYTKVSPLMFFSLKNFLIIKSSSSLMSDA